MSLREALDAAAPDMLEQRWARAQRSHRVYVAVQGPEGRVTVETKHERYGQRLARRLERAPGGLCWTPVP